MPLQWVLQKYSIVPLLVAPHTVALRLSKHRIWEIGLPVNKRFSCVAKGDQQLKCCFEPCQDFWESVLPQIQIIHCFTELRR